MPLSPADVHNVAFSKPPIGKRGYNEDEVDAFLDTVEHEFARLLEVNDELKKRLEDLDQQLSLGGSEAGAGATKAGEVKAGGSKASDTKPTDKTASGTVVAPAQAPSEPATPTAAEGQAPQTSSGDVDPADHHMRAAKILGLAQEMADRLTSESKAEADQLVSGARTKSEAMLSDAKTRSEQMVADAKSRSEQMVTEARTKSEAMLSDARSRSEAMQRQAKEKADALQAESERKHTEMISTITEKRGGLEKHIEELSTFEREYRTRLKSYLQSQLQELDQRGDAAPGDIPRAGSEVHAGKAAGAAGSRTEQGN